MQAPPWNVLATMVAVLGGLVGLHVWATGGTGFLTEPMQGRLAITPATTLSHWWRHLWAGLFHKSWGHLAYNAVVFAVAFPLACRQMGPLQTMANAYWIGPFTVFALHLLLVLPLHQLGVGYAQAALHHPLVGFSVMAYSLAGAALTLASPTIAALAFVALLGYEAVLAVVSTGPFIGAYHVGGFALGYWVRLLWLRL